ncbi:MAG: hypothetical protein BA867_11725 [Desulfobacterales bacterium S5133MH16]|nr:MAG: hypothetical protein BA867_11725 [Desulfobacterales bacterium S5133MH16]
MKNAGKRSLQWKEVFHSNVFALGLVNFFTDLSTEMIYPLLPVFFSGLVPPAVGELTCRTIFAKGKDFHAVHGLLTMSLTACRIS